jgi:hypothetical protein
MPDVTPITKNAPKAPATKAPATKKATAKKGATTAPAKTAKAAPAAKAAPKAAPVVKTPTPPTATGTTARQVRNAEKVIVDAKANPPTTLLAGMKLAVACVRTRVMADPSTPGKELQVTRTNFRDIIADAKVGVKVPDDLAGEAAVRGVSGPRPRGADILTPTARSIVKTGKNRVTKTEFTVHDLLLEDQGDAIRYRWAVVDTENGVAAYTNDRAVANYGVSSPWGWSPKFKKAFADRPVVLPYPGSDHRTLGAEPGSVVTLKS